MSFIDNDNDLISENVRQIVGVIAHALNGRDDEVVVLLHCPDRCVLARYADHFELFFVAVVFDDRGEPVKLLRRLFKQHRKNLKRALRQPFADGRCRRHVAPPFRKNHFHYIILEL